MQLAKQLEDKLGNKLIICTTSALPVLNEFLTAYKQLAVTENDPPLLV